MRLIFRHLMHYKALFLLDFISAFGFALAELGIPTMISNMVDNGIDAGNTSVLVSSFWTIEAISLIGSIGVLLLVFASVNLSTKIVYDIRQELFEHVMKLSQSQVDEVGVSSLITRTSADPYQIMQFLNMIFRSALIAPIMMGASIFLVLRSSVQLSWIVIATIPVIIGGVIIIFRIAGPLSSAQQKSIDKLNEILRENISGIRVIRAFNNQKHEEARFQKENGNYSSISIRLFKLMGVAEPIFFFLMNLAVIAIYSLAPSLLASRHLMIGDLIAFLEYLFHAMMSVLTFCMVFMMYPRASVSAKRIQQVLNMKPAIPNPENAENIDQIDKLVFDHVSFAYPGSDKKILDDLSFEVNKGQTLAVVGSTGSGKSSLGKLIPRFYDISSGAIRINDLPIDAIDLNSLRSQIGYIFQKAHIFSGTIADNLAFGKTEASQKDLEEAAKTAQALDFIEHRDLGFDAQISEEGTNLSGGQKQRLAIARSLAKKPGLYVFDDSFSALDFHTDAKLRKALQPIKKDSIFVIVAQRISTILDADQILVLDQGKAVGLGSHKDLFETCEVYRQIVLSQMSEKEALANV